MNIGGKDGQEQMRADNAKLRALVRDIRDWDVANALKRKRVLLFALPQHIRERIDAMVEGEGHE